MGLSDVKLSDLLGARTIVVAILFVLFILDPISYLVWAMIVSYLLLAIFFRLGSVAKSNKELAAANRDLALAIKQHPELGGKSG
jgi:hypothetical protein